MFCTLLPGPSSSEGGATTGPTGPPPQPFPWLCRQKNEPRIPSHTHSHTHTSQTHTYSTDTHPLHRHTHFTGTHSCTSQTYTYIPYTLTHTPYSFSSRLREWEGVSKRSPERLGWKRHHGGKGQEEELPDSGSSHPLPCSPALTLPEPGPHSALTLRGVGELRAG